MKSFFFLLLSFLLVSSGISILMSTTTCNSLNCKLPNCYCPSMNIPGNLALSDTPQFVFFTLDDSMYEYDFNNMKNYSWILNNPSIKDSLGCTLKLSYYAMEQCIIY